MILLLLRSLPMETKVAKESTANCDAKKGDHKDTGNSDDNLQVADTTMNTEPDETAPGNQVM